MRGPGNAALTFWSSLTADSQHNPDEIPTLVKAVREGADVVIVFEGNAEQTQFRLRRVGQRVLRE